MRASDQICAAKGGEVLFVDPSGEVLAALPVAAGRTPLAEFLRLLPDGCTLQPGKGVHLLPRRCSVNVVHGEGHLHSGANPDFRPTSASRLEREMRVTLNRVKAQSSKLDAMMSAASLVERIPRAPSPDAAGKSSDDGEAVVE